MGHKKTITVEINGMFYNIPTSDPLSKRTLSVGAAVDRAFSQKKKPTGFHFRKDAIAAAKAESRRTTVADELEGHNPGFKKTKTKKRRR